MSKITLFCAETPELKLGPDSQIVFKGGYADVDTDETPDWAEWAFHSGTPHIRVLDADEAKSADAASEFKCPTCGKSFASARGLNGHILSHRPKAEAKPKAPAKPQS